MSAIESTTIGRIGRTRKGRPKFQVPGLVHTFTWDGDAPPDGTEVSVIEFLGWIDQHSIYLGCRHLLEPKQVKATATSGVQPSARQLDRRRSKELRQRKQEIASRYPDRFPPNTEITEEIFTDAELLEIYGPPTPKQLAYVKGLGYAGPRPRTTKEAAQLINDLLDRRSV